MTLAMLVTRNPAAAELSTPGDCSAATVRLPLRPQHGRGLHRKFLFAHSARFVALATASAPAGYWRVAPVSMAA
jgi:hypothetical protein